MEVVRSSVGLGSCRIEQDKQVLQGSRFASALASQVLETKRHTPTSPRFQKALILRDFLKIDSSGSQLILLSATLSLSYCYSQLLLLSATLNLSYCYSQLLLISATVTLSYSCSQLLLFHLLDRVEEQSLYIRSFPTKLP